jgi:hypothetical protein
MRTATARPRFFMDGWWPWPRLERSTWWRVSTPPRSDAAATATPGPLPEQDPTLPLYHDANLW